MATRHFENKQKVAHNILYLLCNYFLRYAICFSHKHDKDKLLVIYAIQKKSGTTLFWTFVYEAEHSQGLTGFL